MIRSPRVGDAGEYRFTVAAEHAIDFADHGMPAVLSTPRLIGFLERAAREAMAPLLEPHEQTVGIHIDVEHLAATPLGLAVTCTARVIHVEGRVVTFQVQAHDEREPIARGLHKRAVIRIDRFAERVRSKAKQAAPPE